jgi:hypothetical protein
MAADGYEHEVTDRVFRAFVDNLPQHEQLLRQIDGQDREGDRHAVETYLREAEASGDVWLTEALAGHSLDEVDVVQLVGAILDRAGAG